MDISLVWLFGVAAIAVVAFVVGWLVSNKMSQTRISGAESLAEKIISEATREAEALKMAYQAIDQGAAGVDMGRNIFQAEDPVAMIQAVRAVVHDMEKPEKAYELYQTLKRSKS